MKTTEFADNVNSDEAAHNEPYHLDLHCLPCSMNCKYDKTKGNCRLHLFLYVLGALCVRCMIHLQSSLLYRVVFAALTALARVPLKAEIFPSVNEIPLHTAF